MSKQLPRINEGQIASAVQNNQLDISIDSFLLRIDMDEVTWISPLMTRLKITYIDTETGEEYDPKIFKSTSEKYEEKGISTHYSIKKERLNFGTNRTDYKKYLFVLVNAKILMEEYSCGITMKNVDKVYEFLNTRGIVNFTYKGFIEGTVRDVDFKTDVRDVDDIKTALKGLKKICKSHDKTNLENRAKHQALYLSESRQKATKEKPFSKFYNKQMELLNHSQEFTRNFLNHSDFKDVLRFETTIKNKNHLAKFGLKNTLFDVLNAPYEIYEEIIHQALKAHLKLDEEIEETIEELKPTAKCLIEFIKLKMAINSTDSESAINEVLNTMDFKDSDQKSKFKKKLFKLWKVYENAVENMDFEIKKVVDEILEKLRVKVENVESI